MSGSVNFYSNVDEKELGKFYSNADAYICMSEHEGFCVPLIEAMAFGVPIFAYDSSAVSETIADAGILFKEKSYNLLPIL